MTSNDYIYLACMGNNTIWADRFWYDCDKGDKMELIEELYNENMWVTDLHKELLEKHVNEDGWDERKILEVLAVSSEGAKKNFLKVFERMGNKKRTTKLKRIFLR